MAIRDLIWTSLDQCHLYLELKLDICPEDELFARSPGSTVQSIAAIYAHAVVTEDHSVQRTFRGTEPLHLRPEWTEVLTFLRMLPSTKSGPRAFGRTWR